MSARSKLGLGTVQFGLAYGISNTRGITPENEVAELLGLAAQHGIVTLDTAPAYAVSEEVLGRTVPSGSSFEIITKTLKDDAQPGETLRRSLARLSMRSIQGLLVHDGDALGGPDGDRLFAQLVALKREGLVKQIGTIVYTAEQIDAVLARFPIDLIQVPVSVVDQRLVNSGHLDRLKSAGVEVHARSVFLQGLLLMEPANLGPHFESVRAHLAFAKRRAAELGLSMLEVALKYALELEQIDRVIVGVSQPSELQQIIDAAQSQASLPPELTRALSWSNEEILNPARWPR